MKKALISCCGAHLRKDSTEKDEKGRFSGHSFGAAETAPKAVREKFSSAGNKRGRGTVITLAASVAFKPFRREDQPMTTSTRIALGLSAAIVSLSLALAPAAFAQDKMGKDDGMKKDSMSKDKMGKDDGMKKDKMGKDDGMKKDTMSKDGMKKDDGMKKN